MSLLNSVVKAGATGLTVVGGTDLTFSEGPLPIQGGKQIIIAADADFRVRRNATCKVKLSQLGSDGSYSKDKKTFTFVAPKLLANGSTVFNLIRIEREVHPESTAAEALELNMIGGQVLSDLDFASFWGSGSLS